MLERIRAAFTGSAVERSVVEASEVTITPEIETAAKQVKYLEGNAADIPANPALEDVLLRFGELTGQSDLSLDELHAQATYIYNQITE